jgi:23S rRNA-/tRNA-specific pseudouridylate synthase
VSINGKRCGVYDTVAAGDAVSYEPEDFDEPPADLSYSIIYEDNWIFAVDKPSDLLVHRAGISFRNNLVYQLRHVRRPPYPDCRPLHRLDRNTSGAVLFAIDSELGAAFGKLFADGLVTKTYKAIVRGHPEFETPFVIDKPIAADNAGAGADGGGPCKFRVDAKDAAGPCRFKVDENGKPATTVIEDAESFGTGFSLLTVRPVTGRTHQIRVHLASVGLPIVGDRVYETEPSGDCSAGRTRHALHCESLSFVHPYTGRRCEIEAVTPVALYCSSVNGFMFVG